MFITIKMFPLLQCCTPSSTHGSAPADSPIYGFFFFPPIFLLGLVQGSVLPVNSGGLVETEPTAPLVVIPSSDSK